MVKLDGQVWLTVREAAALLEVSCDHVRALRRSGVLAGRRDAGPWLVLRAHVYRYQATRGPWRPGGVVGGRAAQIRLGLERDRRPACH